MGLVSTKKGKEKKKRDKKRRFWSSTEVAFDNMNAKVQKVNIHIHTHAHMNTSHMFQEPHPRIQTILIADKQYFQTPPLRLGAHIKLSPIHNLSKQPTLGPAQPWCPQCPVWISLRAVLRLLQKARDRQSLGV